MKKNIFAYFLSFATIFILLSACSSTDDETNASTEKDEHSFHAENGDLREISKRPT